MRFAIMTWVPSGDNAQVGTIFGILDNDKPGTLPLLPHGHWEHYLIVDEQAFKFVEEARKAIAQHGYYLFGAGVTPSDAFGTSQ
ncbi:MAG: hypothetical protein ABSE69_11165 [Roseiarcus sp.]|jgi:hypothetical protein